MVTTESPDLQDTMPQALANTLREHHPAVVATSLRFAPPPAAAAPATDGAEQVSIPKGYLDYLEATVLSLTNSSVAGLGVAAAADATAADAAAPAAETAVAVEAAPDSAAATEAAAVPSIALAAMQHLQHGGGAKAA